MKLNMLKAAPKFKLYEPNKDSLETLIEYEENHEYEKRNL